VLLAMGVNLSFAVFAIKRRSASLTSQILLQQLFEVVDNLDEIR
jgi:hypothetical protein